MTNGRSVLLSVLFCVLANLSCTTARVRFATDGESQVSLVSWDNLNVEGDTIGKTPLDIELDSVKGKVVKISAPGKAPQYWVFADQQGSQLDAKLYLSDLPASRATEAAGIVDLNESHRMLMRSYQALASRDLKLAMDLAGKLAQIAPRLAAPQIIIGLAELQGGNRDAARLAFSKAKTLDPKDADIDQLLQATR